jgi:hypothetical protein
MPGELRPLIKQHFVLHHIDSGLDALQRFSFQLPSEMESNRWKVLLILAIQGRRFEADVLKSRPLAPLCLLAYN